MLLSCSSIKMDTILMKTSNLPALLFLTILMACSTEPNKEITAKYVSNYTFDSYSCNQIELENNRMSEKLDELYVFLKSKGLYDTHHSHAISLWTPRYRNERKPEANDFGELKGMYQALRVAAKAKHCDMAKYISPHSFKI